VLTFPQIKGIVMATQAVQTGLNQIRFTHQDLSHGLLAVGIGVFTYEIISKAVHKVAGETFSKIWMVALTASAFTTIGVSHMALPSLQWRFIALFAAYVMVSIVTRKTEKIKASSLPPT
jgi:hypothetical protein